MPKKRYNAEEIIHKLREADVLIAQSKTVLQTCKQLGVTEQTCYRWRKEYGGMTVEQARRYPVSNHWVTPSGVSARRWAFPVLPCATALNHVRTRRP